MLKKIVSILTLLFVCSTLTAVNPSYAASGVSLFTPYTGLSVTPGETIDYNVDVINNSSSIKDLTFSVKGLPDGWKHTITAGGNDISQLSVKPNSEQQLNLEITVPLEVKKADYRFKLVADGVNGSYAELPFLTTVAEKGTFKTELTSEQPNLEGHADSSFSYTVTLENRTAEKQDYALTSGAPKGWDVTFKSNSKSVTSVKIKPSETKEITVDVSPPKNVKAGTYKIPIKAAAGGTSQNLKLEAVITGSYDIELTTPTGNLSTDITAGGDTTIDLVVKNKGTAPLSDVKIKASTPPDWEAKFDEDTIPVIKPDEKAKVKVTLTAPDEAIAGDYVTTFTAETAQVSSDANFRVSVETSTLWGFISILIILGVLSVLYFIIRKYGRR